MNRREGEAVDLDPGAVGEDDDVGAAQRTASKFATGKIRPGWKPAEDRSTRASTSWFQRTSTVPQDDQAVATSAILRARIRGPVSSFPIVSVTRRRLGTSQVGTSDPVRA